MVKGTVTLSDEPQIHVYTVEDAREGCWKNRTQFLLTSLGFSIGFGNIWRFSWVAIANGGGAFYVPYLITTFTLVLTMLRMEFRIGQHLRLGPIRIWSALSPFTCGVGVATSIICFTVASYYIIILCWCMHYFLNSFQSPLPWLFCLNSFNELINHSQNETITNLNTEECYMSGPASYYWYRETLNISDSLEDAMEIRWKLFIVLIFLWIIVFLAAAKGLKGTVNVIYVTLIFPYLALIILALRAVYLEGAEDGIIYLFKPDWSYLARPTVWANAATQSLFSVGIGFGTMTMYATMNPICQNSLVDALFIVTSDALTSFIGGIVVFSMMGFSAHLDYEKCSESFKGRNTTNFPTGFKNPVIYDSSNCSVNYFLENTTGGTGLAFIGFTQTILQIPGAALFSAVFFFMLFSLGFNSFFGFINPLFKVVHSFPYLEKRSPYLASGVICIFGFVLSVLFATTSGDYFLQIFSALAQDIPIILIGLVQAIAGGYLLNFERESGTGNMNRWSSLADKCCNVFDKVINPLALVLIFITRIILNQHTNAYSAWNREKATLEQKKFPNWAYLLAIGLAIIGIIPLPLGCLYGVYKIKRKITDAKKNVQSEK